MKAITILCAALGLVLLTAQPAHATDAPSIVGIWLGTDDMGVKGGFIFNADGSADMLRNGESFKATVVKNTGTITYKYDASVTPNQLDIIVTRTGGGSQTLPCIVQFIDADHLRMRQPNGGPRPKDFNGAAKNEIIVLGRAKADNG